MNLFRALREQRSAWPEIGVDEWIDMMRLGGAFGGAFSLQQTLPGQEHEYPPLTFVEYARQLYRDNSIVFSCMDVRSKVFSEAKFKYRRRFGAQAGQLWSDDTLAVLEQPWPGATTRTLLGHMEQDASLGGNAYVARITRDRLRRLRPDWVTIVLGSHEDPDVGAWDVNAELLGYLYHPGGVGSGRDPKPFLPEEVAHYKPIPDPEAEFRGMSWLTPVIQEVLGDKAATKHKLAFFENGATPNMVVKLDPNIKAEDFNTWIKAFKERYTGALKAYETLYLGGGADVTVVGADFKQLDFKTTVGVSETRVAAAAGVPPTVVGLSEGLQGSSLNEGNYGQARRRMADATMRPLWGEACAALSQIVRAPTDSELWYDDHIPFLQEDEKDDAQIAQQHASAIKTLIDAGFEPATAVSAVHPEWASELQHSGLVSVQLQPPGSKIPPDNTASDVPPASTT